jgi:hypothetical protein
LSFKLGIVVVLVIVLAACGRAIGGTESSTPTPGSPTPTFATPSQTQASPASGARAIWPSPQPTVPADWKTITDSKLGYTFRYPGSWTDVSAFRGDPPGTHEVATSTAVANPMNLGPKDWHFTVIGSFPPNSVIGCGEPAYGDKLDTVLGGQPAHVFFRLGWQADPNEWIIDVIASVNGNCWQLQQTTGNAISRDDASATFAQIEASFRFGPSS